MGSGDHRCEWRDKAESLEAQLAAAAARLGEATNTITALSERVTSLQSTVEKLQRHVYGQRSEKMPRVSDEIRDASTAEADREAALEKRRANAAKKRELPTRRIEHKIPEERKVCPKCGVHDFTPLGEGKLTEVYELVPARIERQLHVQEKARCRCGETIISVDPPAKVFDKTRFGPTFMAQVAVSKCADSIGHVRQGGVRRVIRFD
jgi:transposase